MKCKNILLMLFFGFMILLLGAALQQDSPGSNIGVINIPIVFSKYQKWNDICIFLRDREKVQQEELAKLSTEVKELEKKFAGLDPDSKDYNLIQARIIKKKTFLATLENQYKTELSRSETSKYEAVFKEIQLEISLFAKRAGLSIVLQKTLELPEGFWESVLYSDESVDITNQVLSSLNKKYVKSK